MRIDGLSVGTDLVRISLVAESVTHFGERFLRRIFTPAERAYAEAGEGLMASRLAARMAAKEALIKALDLAERGVGWSDIEVVRSPSGAPSLRLHGAARLFADEFGVNSLSVSLSHEGDYATATVITTRESK
jgi:holo-[acyl-carrier protein] synthase